MWSLHSLFLAFPALAAATNPSVVDKLPVVDLGYERHRAISLDKERDYYNFTNIRYGQAPVGDLRWAKPKAPVKGHYINGQKLPIVDGSEQGGNCPARFPCWFEVQSEFTGAYLANIPFDFDNSYEKIYADPLCSQPPPPEKRPQGESEDCLFLDVLVPRTVMDAKKKPGSKGAPVLVHLYGGGFAGGSKKYWGFFGGSPAGLIERSRNQDKDGIIYVSFNYRLGALGFMMGPDFVSQGGVQNLGLFDQRLALNWIQENIHLFGGDPNRVTVMGESAGGGSIIMQMTAYGKALKAPFQQAVTQSAAWEPYSASIDKQNEIFHYYLDMLNVTSLEEAKKLPTEKLIDVNFLFLSSSTFATTYFGAVVDGDFLPDEPKRMLLDGRGDPNVKLFTTISSNEGLRFTPGNITTDADFIQYVGLLLGAANDTVRDHVANVIYPPIFNGSYPWSNHLERAGFFQAELVTTCNSRYMHAASKKRGYGNLFDVWPALHQGDVPYFFWDGAKTISSINATVAEITQNYITAFTITGNVNNNKSPHVPLYDPKTLFALTENGFSVVDDPTNNYRCDYFHDSPYEPYKDWR